MEIAIVDNDGLVLIDTIVNPNVPISEDALKVHGISQEMVKDQPTFSEIKNQIINAVDGKLVVMFSAEADLKFFPEHAAKLIDSECCMSWIWQCVAYGARNPAAINPVILNPQLMRLEIFGTENNTEH